VQVGVFLPGLFVLCMLCHGELARERPAASQLTRFYQCVASGGVIGGALVGLGAPLVLPGYFEVEIGLVLAAIAIAWRASPAHWCWRVLALLLPPLALGATLWRIQEVSANAIALKRSFYGVITIRERGNERTLMHGSIMHGRQVLAADQRRTPTTYYTATSGVGRLLNSLSGRPIVVGAVGLGAGTVAAYGRLGDAYRFFEIDPHMVDAARRHCTYLADSRASVSVITGDGRLALEAEPPARYDAIVADAFSGDSIPVHLLARTPAPLSAIAAHTSELPPGAERAWSDDYSNIVRSLRAPGVIVRQE
jgi:hypothetical protein